MLCAPLLEHSEPLHVHLLSSDHQRPFLQQIRSPSKQPSRQNSNKCCRLADSSTNGKCRYPQCQWHELCLRTPSSRWCYWGHSHGWKSSPCQGDVLCARINFHGKWVSSSIRQLAQSTDSCWHFFESRKLLLSLELNCVVIILTYTIQHDFSKSKIFPGLSNFQWYS